MFGKKNSFSLTEAKKFLNRRGLELFKRSLKSKSNETFKNLYYTLFAGIIIILVSFFIPIFTISSG